MKNTTFPYFVGLLVLILALIVFKIPHLALPYYWDEAWSYGTAIRMMEARGPGLLPDALPTYFSRGHPLLFYFISSTWMKIFGTSVFASHLLALLISICLVGATFYFGKIIFGSTRIGFIAAFALLFQPIFLAQSALLLPEVMVALLSLTAIYFYLKNQRIGYIISASLLLLTKESGLTLIATLLLWSVIIQLSSRNFKQFIRECLYIAIPLLPFVVFLLSQRIINGWFFYPEHVAYVSSGFSDFYDKLEKYFAYTFIYQGRNLLFFSLLAAVLIILIRKIKIEKPHRQAIQLLVLFSVVYLLFSSANFFSNRYMLSVISPLALLFAFCILIAFNYKWTPIAAVIVIALLQWRQINIHTPSDHNLGYADVVKVHQKTVDYCVEQNWQDKNIYAHFLMEGNLTNPYSGYLPEQLKFHHVTGKITDSTQYFIFSNVEDHSTYDSLKHSGSLRLITRFEKDKAWAEIYERVK